VSTRRSPTIILIALFVLFNVGRMISAANGREAPSGFQSQFLIGVGWAISWWVLIDCRDRGIATSIDHGFFAFWAWPILLPYHLIQTRGIRGFALLAALIGVYLATYLLALPIYFLLR
jgi:hypothetical protein